jgi:hypothetical protein
MGQVSWNALGRRSVSIASGVFPTWLEKDPIRARGALGATVDESESSRLWLRARCRLEDDPSRVAGNSRDDSLLSQGEITSTLNLSALLCLQKYRTMVNPSAARHFEMLCGFTAAQSFLLNTLRSGASVSSVLSSVYESSVYTDCGHACLRGG